MYAIAHVFQLQIELILLYILIWDYIKLSKIADNFISTCLCILFTNILIIFPINLDFEDKVSHIPIIDSKVEIISPPLTILPNNGFILK